MDGIVRSTSAPGLEFAAIEVAPNFTHGEKSTKWLKDFTKLARVLRDMMVRIKMEGHHVVAAQHNIMGIVFSGYNIQFLRLGMPMGHVCLLSRSRPVSVPRDVRGLPMLLLIIKQVIQASVCIP